MENPPRESPAYAWLRQCAVQALQSAEREPENSAQAMSALIHTALMAETFLDFLGGHLDRDWSSKGRRFSKYKRLRVFRLALGIAGDVKARPWRSVADAFDFHDLVMYGRIDADEKREALALSEDELAAYALGEDWRDFCSVETAQQVFGDVDEVIDELLRAVRKA